MIPLGVLAGSRHVPAGGGGALSLSFVGTSTNSSNQSAYTFTDLAIGPAAPDRLVIVAAGVRKAPPSPTLSAMTIGGVAATIDAVEGVASGNLVVIGHALVPSGTTATVTITYSATVLRCGVGVWAATGGAAHDASYTSTGSTDAGAVVTVPDSGCAVAAVMTTNAGSVTWSNATERYDQTIEAAGHSGADTATPGTATITATGAGANDMTLAVAAYRPA